jgi:hypothetical protein
LTSPPPDGEFTIWIGDTPPSFQLGGVARNRFALDRSIKGWREIFGGLLLAVKDRPRGCSHVECEVFLTFPQRRRRDLENYRPVLSKALGDALQDVRVIPDDTSANWTLTMVDIVEPGVHKTEVVVTWRQ